MDIETNDEAFLELDGEQPLADPTPELPVAHADEAFLELVEATQAAQTRVLSDDDLAVVTSLADDATPLLAALWPRRPALIAEVPDAQALRERLGDVRRTLNKVTRRGPEWRARAEVAAASLARRLATMPGGDALLPAACAELVTWSEHQLAERVREESALDQSLREPELKRLRSWCDARGVAHARIDELAERAGVRVLHGVQQSWAGLEALPDAPRSLDDAARSLTEHPAQAVEALRQGALSAWLRAHRCPEALCAVADEAERVCRSSEGTEGAPTVAVWSLAWAMGLDGVSVDGLVVTSADTLRAHLRGGRIDAQRLRAAAPVLSAWFERLAAHGLAHALAKIDDGPFGEERVAWSLGEPLRLGERNALDTTQLAREVLQRRSSRSAALARLEDGSLVAWLEALPAHRRDPAWRDLLLSAGDELARERAFWLGIYRRAPRAPLRLALDEEGRRLVRFDSLADLLQPARAAAAWSALRDAWRRGELEAWLGGAAPGIELDLRPALDPDRGTHALLWSLGFVALVMPWGRAGAAARSPGELVDAWRRNPKTVEAVVAQGLATTWLRRMHPHVGVSAVSLDEVAARWGEDLGASTDDGGAAALRLALLCGASVLPRRATDDDDAPEVAWESIDTATHDLAAWQELPPALISGGHALLWAAGRVPAAGLIARRWLQRALDDDGALRELASIGAPVPSVALREANAREAARREALARRRALEAELERLATRREAARVALEGEGERLVAAQDAARQAAATEAARREVADELARVEADRDAARDELARSVARAEAEREAERATREREQAERALAHQRAELESDAQRRALERERDEARLQASQAAAALMLQSARQSALEAELATESARRRIAEARLAQEEVGDALEALARKDIERVEALRRLREAEAAMQAEETRQRRALRSMEAEAEKARARAAELTARAAEVEAEARSAEALRRAALDARIADDEAARRRHDDEVTEAATRASDAARAAREAAVRREEEVAAAWAEAKRTAEEELERLTEALRGVEREAAAIEVAPVEERVADPYAALVGSIESEDDEVALEGFDEAEDPDAARAEYAFDRLAESYRVTDDHALEGLRRAVDRWARRHPRHPWADLATRMHLRAVELIPAFELHISTRFEARSLELRDGTLDDAVPVPGEAVSAEGVVDPWAIALPPSDPWMGWDGRLVLDRPIAREPCPSCAVGGTPGESPCLRCDGRSTIPCATCEGWSKVRCPSCVGGGELATASGSIRCDRCEGRRTVTCERCVLGRVPCDGCGARGAVPCARCDGNAWIDRVEALHVSSSPVTSLRVVAGALPEALHERVRARDAESDPVVFVEADALEIAAVVRELPHRALAAAVGSALTAERGAESETRRVTRQRLIVRRYPAWRMELEVEGRAHTLWVHGARGEVHTDDSPLARWLDDEVEAARDALTRGDIAAAVDRLGSVMAADVDHAGGREAARAVGEAVRAMALRGELFEARDAADRAAVLRWPECMGPLADAERVLGRRLSHRADWSIIEDARAALERGRLERCAEHLGELPEAARSRAEVIEITMDFCRRSADLARAQAARGELDQALARVRVAEALPIAGTADAMRGVREELERSTRRRRLAGSAPWIVTALALTALALSLLR